MSTKMLKPQDVKHFGIDRKIQSIMDYAEDNADFDDGFVLSVKKQWEKYGTLSVSQINALNNIIDRFKIEVLEDLVDHIGG